MSSEEIYQIVHLEQKPRKEMKEAYKFRIRSVNQSIICSYVYAYRRIKMNGCCLLVVGAIESF